MPHLADSIEPALVGGELCLKGAVFLQLALQVGRLTVTLVLCDLQLLVDPSTDLHGHEMSSDQIGIFCELFLSHP